MTGAKSIWKVNCSPKVKQFLWKLKSKSLSVGEALLRRGMTVTGTCKRCGTLESEMHVFFQCPFASRIWDNLPALNKPSLMNCNSLEDLLTLCRNIINLPPCGVSVPLYPWLLWSLWTSRNQYLFEDNMFTENEVLMRATRLAHEWQKANLPKALPNRTPTLPLHPTDLAVSPSVIQCFSDAAWDKESGNSGLGWCFQGGSARICKQGSAHRPFVASALAAEAWALKKALKDAIASNFKDMVVFSDSKCLVSLLKDQSVEISIKFPP